MKTEPKPFASLSSGLLARKGAARPAMRPQGFGSQTGSGLEDLGWNDMGFEPPKPADAARDSEHDAFGEELTPHPTRNPLAALTPVGSPVHEQQAEIVDRLVVPDEEDETAEYETPTFEVEEYQASEYAADEQEAEEYIDETAELVDVEAVVRVPEPAKPQAIARPRRQPRPRSVPGTGAKAAFTLRLDPSRHLKLRLACAVNGRSAQQLVTDAVDRLLNEMPELESMAERAPKKQAQA